MKIRQLQCLILILFSMFFQTSFATTIDQIIVFGDSMSDNGNFYALTLGFIPKKPYFEGRFTNGPVWVENVAMAMDTPLYDYAYGGAWAESYVDSGPFVAPGLGMQVNMYLVSAALDRNKGDHLFVIWAGANDYIKGRSDAEYATSNTVSTIQNQIDWLVYYGAKNFLVIDIPNISVTPEIVAKGPKFAEAAAKLVDLHNLKMAQMIEKERALNPGVTFIHVEEDKYFSDVLKNPVKYNITNTTDACYNGTFYLKGMKSLANDRELMTLKKEKNIDVANNPSLMTAYATVKMADAGTTSCKNPENYLYWDTLHPTVAIHQIISLLALTMLDEAGIQGKS